MAAKGKLTLVRESEASGRTSDIFRELKTALGMPYVSLLYKAYAAYPRFLDLHWQAFKPVLETQEFFDLAERLRAEAYTRMHNYFRIPDLCARLTEESFSPGAQNELTRLVETLHAENAPVLLLAAAALQAFDKPVGSDRKTHPAQSLPTFPMPILVEEERAPAATRKIYEEMKRTLDLPVLNLDYRALGRWPDFLRDYWQVLRPMSESPVYRESCQGLRETAVALAGEIPIQVSHTVTQLQDAGMKDEDVAAVVRITEMFTKSLARLVMNIALAKIGLEGGSSADAVRTQERAAQPPMRVA
jgi:hypothetical protein